MSVIMFAINIAIWHQLCRMFVLASALAGHFAAASRSTGQILYQDRG